MSDQDTDHIPSMIPERDELSSYQRQNSGRQAKKPSAGGAGLLARLFITVALVAGAAACAWAFQLQEQLQKSDKLLFQYEARIKDLEDRLSDTDESVSQSSVTMQVKIKELYSEVDKLWASAWRKNKANITTNKKIAATNAANLKNYKKSLDTQVATSKSNNSKLVAVSGRVDKLDKLAGSISQMSENQRQLEKLGDQLHKLNLASAQLKKRVTTNEEWVESINGFRKQVNRNMNSLKQSVGQLQGSAAPAP
jgi:chromosome segregation ATPase